jgi:hypothetical protein
MEVTRWFLVGRWKLFGVGARKIDSERGGEESAHRNTRSKYIYIRGLLIFISISQPKNTYL